MWLRYCFAEVRCTAASLLGASVRCVQHHRACWHCLTRARLRAARTRSSWDERMGDQDPAQIFELLEKLGEGCVPHCISRTAWCSTRGECEVLTRTSCAPLRSSYGSVYRAIHRESGTTVAVKIIAVEDDIDDVMREIEILRRCKSEYIVQYFGSYFKGTDLWVRPRRRIGEARAASPCFSVRARADRDGVLRGRVCERPHGNLSAHAE